MVVKAMDVYVKFGYWIYWKTRTLVYQKHRHR